MKLDHSALADLQIALELCERPLRCAGKPMAHEDIPRSPDGLPIIELGNENVKYLPECQAIDQHLCCPHMIARETPFLNRILQVITNTTTRIDVRQLQVIKIEARELDVAMRHARTNTFLESDLQNTKIPSKELADAQAKEIEERFIAFCKANEQFRLKLVKIFRSALEENKEDA